MYISEAKIQNYRNYSDTTISFYEHLNVIIGENNAGKSNLLKALRLVLDKNFPKNLEAYDFYNFLPEAKKYPQAYPSISISITLQGKISENINDQNATALVADWIIDFKADSWIAQLTYEFFMPEENQKKTYFSFDNAINSYTYKIYGGKPELKQKANSESLARIGYYFVDATRNAEKDLSTGRQNLLKNVMSSLLNRTDTIKSDEFSAASKQLLTNLKNRINLESINNLSNDLGFNDIGTFGIEGELTEDELIKTIQLVFQGANDSELPIQSNGLGYNNIFYIAMLLNHLKTNTKTPNNIIFPLIVIEEPEAHLHPSMQYQILAWLEKETIQDNRQIFITTHSPNMVAAAGIDPLIILYKKESSPRETSISYPAKVFSNTEEDKASKTYIERFLDVTQSDIFFAKKILFVEGISEVLLMNTFAKYLGKDLIKSHVAVIQIGNNNTFSHFIKLFGAGLENDNQLESYSVYACYKKVACLTDKDPTRKLKKPKSSRFESCYPNELNQNPIQYDYKEISDTIQKLNKIMKQSNIESVKICFNNNPEGKTLEYDFAFCNPTNILLDIAEKADTTKPKLNSLLQALSPELDGKTDPHNIAKYYLDTIATSKSKAAFQLVSLLEQKKRDGITDIKIPQYIIDAINFLTEP